MAPTVGLIRVPSVLPREPFIVKKTTKEATEKAIKKTAKKTSKKKAVSAKKTTSKVRKPSGARTKEGRVRGSEQDEASAKCRRSRHLLKIAGRRIGLGKSRDVELEISQSTTGVPVVVPVRVVRGEAPGPAVFLTGAVHGDELNGMAAIHQLLKNELSDGELKAGSLVMVPVVNLQGFERGSRYLPDRRDLNRSFPGSAGGSGAKRLAHALFRQIVEQCDYGIDMHTGSGNRTNYPNVRGDLRNLGVRRIARAFGTEVILNGAGPTGSLRAAACAAGCPTIVYEGGEVGKAEPGVVAVAVRGVRNVLSELGMLSAKATRPRFQIETSESTWVRSDYGGLLDFHVTAGEIVEAGQPVATCVTLLGKPVGTVVSKASGVVIGMTMLPTVTPGDPVCHVAIASDGVDQLREDARPNDDPRLLDEVREQLATNLVVSDVGSDAP